MDNKENYKKIPECHKQNSFLDNNQPTSINIKNKILDQDNEW